MITQNQLKPETRSPQRQRTMTKIIKKHVHTFNIILQFVLQQLISRLIGIFHTLLGLPTALNCPTSLYSLHQFVQLDHSVKRAMWWRHSSNSSAGRGLAYCMRMNVRIKLRTNVRIKLRMKVRITLRMNVRIKLRTKVRIKLRINVTIKLRTNV